jgi:hypothetical protein
LAVSLGENARTLPLWLYAISDAYLMARRTLSRGPQRQHAQP